MPNSAPIYEMKLLFRGSEEPIVLRNASMIKRIPLVARSFELHSLDWEKKGARINGSIRIPFGHDAAEFLFQHLSTFSPPDVSSTVPATVEANYKAAAGKTLEQLKEIIEFAHYLECADFMECIGFVIAKKMESLSIEECARFMGVECQPKAHFFTDENGWVHPPDEIFDQKVEGSEPASSG